MKILALETSTPCGGAAVVVDGKIAAEAVTRRQRSHSELLHVFTDQVLREAGLTFGEIDGFAVGLGPGSFTGIRVAANAGRTFAAAFEKPLIAVDTLAQIASRTKDRSRPVLALINAFKNMVYFGLFDVSTEDPICLRGPGVLPLAELDQLPSGPVTVVGDGWEIAESAIADDRRSLFVRESKPIDETSPGTLGLLAHLRAEKGLVLSWKAYTPLYLRASEAEENKRGALFKKPDAKETDHGKGR